MSVVATPSLTVEPTVLATTGLDFPGNDQYPSASDSIIFGWNVSNLGTGAPFSRFPATYIWKAYPRPNNDTHGSFWTFMFHARWETIWTQSSLEYYGCHPYPASDYGGTNVWEISNIGSDRFDYPDDIVTFNQWYTQVVRAWKSGGTTYISYYWNWPTVTSDEVINRSNPDSPANTNPAIIVGDAPWNQGFEVPNAILRGFQYYDALLSEAQVASELTTPGSVRTPWYLNLNPTPTDISDKSGNGNDPAWFGVNRPSLWTP